MASLRARLSRSPLAQRIASLVFAVFIVAYLAMITYGVPDELTSRKKVIMLAFLWFIGLVAMAILARAWRKPGSRSITR